MMNSREIVRRTLEYENPERVAHSFPPSDIGGAGNTVKTHATDWQQVGENRWEHTDAWGNLWARVDPTSAGECVRGVLEGMEDYEEYEFPDFSNPADYEITRQARADSPDRWVNGGLPGFAFNIARKLRSLDQYLMDILLEREKTSRLHDRIDDMLADMIRNYGEAGLDGVMFCEDWGTQDRTLVSPDLWYEEFFPRFRRLCGLAHDCGLRVFMHSCGQNEAIVPGLMKAGIDCLQFDQPDLHGIDTLAGHQEKGKITFWCPVDIQKCLQTRDEKTIREKAREMLDKLWRGRGGFIAGYYGDNKSIGLDPKWQQIACDEFASRGVAAGAPDGA